MVERLNQLPIAMLLASDYSNNEDILRMIIYHHLYHHLTICIHCHAGYLQCIRYIIHATKSVCDYVCELRHGLITLT